MFHKCDFFSVSLDPDDSGPILGHPGFERLKIFLSEEKWTGKILSDIAEWASKLPSLRPLNGVHYSLRNEGKNNFIVSMAARFCLRFLFYNSQSEQKYANIDII